MRKSCLIISFLIAFILPLTCQAKKELIFVGMNGLTPMEGGIVMLGDSITASGQWSELLNARVRNAGMDGWKTYDIIKNASVVISGIPNYAFLCVGINDIMKGRKTADILRNYEGIITTIQSISPSSVIVLQSVLPTRNKAHRAKIDALNNGIQSLAATYGLTYIDVHPLMTDSDGLLRREYSFDSVHINGFAYEVWAGKIREVMGWGE